MKIWYIECTVEELRANRGIMDGVVDAMTDMFNGVFGNCKPVFDEEDVEEGDDE